MARQNEIKCLEALKNAFLCETRISIYSNCESTAILNYIFTALPNDKENDFPDFIFDGGGIEHFQLTTSIEGKKGAKFKIEENANKEVRERHRSMVSEAFASLEFVPGTITTDSYEEIYESFSYDDFLHSLEKNIKKHVISLHRLQYEKKIVVFLMEQQTPRLWLDEGVIPIKFYELHNDKKALEIIEANCKDVNYLVYFVCDSIEIIEIAKVKDLIKKAHTYENVRGGRLVKGEIALCQDIFK